MKMTRTAAMLFALLMPSPAVLCADDAARVSLAALSSPVIFRGDSTTAYRDPAAIFHDGWFRLFSRWSGSSRTNARSRTSRGAGAAIW